VISPIPFIDILRRRDADSAIPASVFADCVVTIKNPLSVGSRWSPWSCSILFLDYAGSVEDGSEFFPGPCDVGGFVEWDVNAAFEEVEIVVVFEDAGVMDVDVPGVWEWVFGGLREGW